MTTGMVLGKFLPPHAGHVYLCEFARACVSDLTIVVGTLANEPIAGESRVRWMRELFPFDRVVHLTDENPQQPHEHPQFWAIWKASLMRVLPSRPDFVFASDAYGRELAKVLGARFVQVDEARAIVPISGTELRADPIAHFEYIPRCVRPHFVKRVSIFGPESTGKTTLARDLAAAFHTAWVPEWARTVLERRGGSIADLDWNEIIRGQCASEESRARDANRVLFCDTDPLATIVWADALGAPRLEGERDAFARKYDLTLLLKPDVPWIKDSVRYLPNESAVFFSRCEDALKKMDRAYVVIDGTWDERLAKATRAVQRWMTREI
jgi:HTH-type transcriptional repressor of NAD biosynthesis genes